MSILHTYKEVQTNIDTNVCSCHANHHTWQVTVLGIPTSSLGLVSSQALWGLVDITVEEIEKSIRQTGMEEMLLHI